MEREIRDNSMQIDATKSERSSIRCSPERQVFDMLATFYAAMGNAPEAKGALALMATALTARADPGAINAALNRCMVETGGYPVRLPHIFARIAGLDADVNAEKRLAWETVERFVSKWVRWNSERTSAYLEQGAPDLAPRIVDTVRRSGGWSVYLRMTDEDFPHQQKRFFEEYEAWAEVQHVAADPSRVLEMPNLKQLAAAKAIERPKPDPAPDVTPAAPKDPQKARIMKHIANLRTQRRI